LFERALQTALGILGTAASGGRRGRPDKWKSIREFRNARVALSSDTPLGKTYDAHRDCPSPTA